MASPASSVSSPAWQRQRDAGRTTLSLTAGATAIQWQKKPIVLPSCAIGIPQYKQDHRHASKKLRHDLKMEEFDFHDRHGGGGDVEGLRALLRHKFGNAARGWRLAIAPHGDHDRHDHARAGAKVTLFSDFCLGLKNIGFSGNGKTCWKVLTKGKSTAWLEDLDPKLAVSMDTIAGAIAKHYPDKGAHEAFNDIEREHEARVTADEFDAFLFDGDILPHDSRVSTRQVFECLVLSGRGNLTQEEIRYLDLWANRRLGYTFPEPVPKQKPEPEHWSPPPPKPPHVPDLKDFRKHCEQRFGSPARAWRIAIDVKTAGSIACVEFGMACRQMGWHHPHHSLWNELVEAGGGAATLRGLDPATCSAIDTLIERMLPAFGDLETFWSEVLDPDGDGICSRGEWVKTVSKEMGLSGKAAGLIFTVLDVVHSGWLSFSELGFLDDFIPNMEMEGDMTMSMDQGPSLFSSMSAGTLDPNEDLQGWASTSFGGTTGAGSTQRSRSFSNSTHSLHPGSTQRSSRAMQYRQYANCHMAKYRWMGSAAAAHTRSMSEGSAWATLRKEVHPKMPTVGGTPLSDVFRFTNEFYREGCRRLQYHHEQQSKTELKKTLKIQAQSSLMEKSSNASSQRSPSSGKLSGSR